MFEGLVKSKFFSKCKSDIKLIRTRIEIIKRKRNATQKYLRNDVADLLRNGFDVEAFGRAEGLLAEMAKSQCYELIDQYCEHILKNLSVMNKQRECPEDCREAASSLMYAAARFADLPELRELRTLFSERYGNSLDYYVSKQFTEKVKSDPASNDMKLQLLQEIAAESGLEWDSEALENKLFKESAYVKKASDQRNAGTEYEFLKSEELAPERNEERLPRKIEVGSPPVKVKDIQEDKPRLIPPPYTKPEVDKAKSSSTDESDSSDEAVLGANPVGRSVRTRHRKPSPGQEIAEGDRARGVNKENVAQGRRILRFFDGGRDQRDEEEKMMDKLLRHYSRTNKDGKSGAAVHGAKGSSRVNGRTRASSLRVEPTSPKDSPMKHSRAASLEPGLLNGNGHVHPKLPDYDEFVARLAAFRGK